VTALISPCRVLTAADRYGRQQDYHSSCTVGSNDDPESKRRWAVKEKSLMQIEIFSIMINSVRKNIGKITLGREASFLKCSLSARNLPIFIFSL